MLIENCFCPQSYEISKHIWTTGMWKKAFIKVPWSKISRTSCKISRISCWHTIFWYTETLTQVDMTMFAFLVFCSASFQLRTQGFHDARGVQQGLSDRFKGRKLLWWYNLHACRFDMESQHDRFHNSLRFSQKSTVNSLKPQKKR